MTQHAPTRIPNHQLREASRATRRPQVPYQVYHSEEIDARIFYLDRYVTETVLKNDRGKRQKGEERKNVTWLRPFSAGMLVLGDRSRYPGDLCD